jgi:subtilisin family serine protease
VLRDRPGYRNSVIAMADQEAVRDLSDRSEVAWVEPALPATGPSLVNANQRSRVDEVRGAAEFLGVDGSGTRVGVLDWFPDGVHTDFWDRVTPVEVRWGEHYHGALVSGCIAGAGTLEPRATGVAPGAALFWTSWVDDPWPAMERLHDVHGVTIVNNSWNTKPGWRLSTQSWHGDLWAFGYYHERAAAADTLVRDTDLLVVFSAGNKRKVSFLGPHTHGSQYGFEDDVSHEDLHPANPRFSSIAGAAVGKNVLTVGGTTKEDEIVYFSSLGPTDDGRVKPDLVAVALDVLSTSADDGYEVDGGTSISSPLVAGIAALLTDLSRRRHGRDPDSTVLKGLLIHSTRDLDQPGPDFYSGFGMADAELAARVLDAAVFNDAQYRPAPRRSGGRIGSSTTSGTSTGNVKAAITSVDEMRSLVIEGMLDQGESSYFVLPITSECDELRVTLVWHDPPGPELVNDLDLSVVAPDGRRLHPFVLDPNRPSAAASRGINHRDNVEQIRINDPTIGRWRILVNGTSVADGPQGMALIASAGEGNRPPERLSVGDLVVEEFFVTGDGSSVDGPSPWTVFSDGDRLDFYIEGTILANADYGDFFGSITLTASVTDADGDTVVRFSGAGHNVAPGPLEVLFAVGLEIPAELPAGDYTAHVELAMHNGVASTAECQFTVESPG